MKKNQVVIYTNPKCPYCIHSKAILESKGVNYQEINVLEKPEEFNAIRAKYSVDSVPQIFIGIHINGDDNLTNLEQSGKLDVMLDDPNVDFNDPSVKVKK